MRVPENERDFPAECKAMFMELTDAAKAAPFHADKRVYLSEAEQWLDAYLDYRHIEGL